ncbi:hypothetical protein WJX73_003980 [Symbiochloris irregularis]|uniref:Glycosyl transferase family 1 domain-containing protein n=1 Tax=Symbiochloris irregularis TaxID=706552 RepID=A0AAW1P0K1_9CHLO
MPLRVLFITLEFSAATFSGNGVCAQSQVRALTKQGHKVLVISGRPADCKDPPKPQGATQLHEVPLPSWGRLDRQSPWQEFAAACTRLGALVSGFQPQVVWGVDWTSLHPYYEISGRLHPPEELDSGALPYVFMNYRVFSRSVRRESESDTEREFLQAKESEAVQAASLVAALGLSDAGYIHEHLMPASLPQEKRVKPVVILPALRSDLADLPLPDDVIPHLPPARSNSNALRLYSSMNGLALSDSSDESAQPDLLSGLAPSQQDRSRPQTPEAEGSRTNLAAQEALPSLDEESSDWGVGPSKPKAAAGVAALQADCRLAGEGGPAPQLALVGKRIYLTCCVRLSPEKEPLRFVDLVEQLARSGALQQHQITPVLVGSAKSAFADLVRAKLQAAWPSSLLMDKFLGPAELAELYSCTRLNFHPCTYDAYGMTIVEAASQGAPTLVDHNKDVGATDLLSPEAGEVLTADYGLPKAELARLVADLLRPESAEALMKVGARAASKARQWTEPALGEVMTEILAGVVDRKPDQ